MDLDSRIYIAGHKGLVGSALVRNLQNRGYSKLIMKTRQELDLTRQSQVEAFFASERPEYVFLAAARVGGIKANNTYPADFIMQNLQIECNVIESAYRSGVKKLMFLGSSCIYPKLSPQPIKEEYLLTGPLELSNEAYAVAKIAGLKLCQYYNKQYGTRFICVMPTNLYGPNDNFDPQNSHVLPALIYKLYEAKIQNLPCVRLWGTGTPRREFLHVDDMAEACVLLMLSYEGNEFVNIGTGHDITIKELAETIKEVVGFVGKVKFNSSKPDGTPRKLLDVSKLKGLGWNYKTELKEGIIETYKWFEKATFN
jgi:GDP-L-fucose synthase